MTPVTERNLPTPTDPETAGYWAHYGGAELEDSMLLAAFHRWRTFQAQIAERRERKTLGPDEAITELADNIAAHEGQMIRHSPVGFTGAHCQLEVAARLLAHNRIDPDSSDNLAVAFGLVTAVMRALGDCEGWLDWKDRETDRARPATPEAEDAGDTEPASGPSDAEEAGTVTELYQRWKEAWKKASAADEAAVRAYEKPEKAARDKEHDRLRGEFDRIGKDLICVDAGGLAEIGMKMEAVFEHAGLVADARPIEIDEYGEALAVKGLRSIYRDVKRLTAPA